MSPRVRQAALAAAVIAVAFLSNFLARGIVDTFLVFMEPLERDFGWTHDHLARVYSIYLVTLGLASPLTGALLDSWGPRPAYLAGAVLLAAAMWVAGRGGALWHFYLGPGVLCGLAASLMGMVPAAALLGRWFDRKLGLVIAVAYAGFGSGMLAIVPLARAGIDALGWRQTYGVLFWCCVVLVPLAAVLPWRRIAAGAPGNPRAAAREARPAAGAGPAAGPPRAEWTRASAMRTAEFWLLVQVMVFTALANYLVSVQTISFLISRGYPPLGAAFVFGAAGTLSVAGVLVSGWATLRFGYRPAMVVSFAGTLTGILAMLAYSAWPHPALVWLFTLAFGTSQGARGPVVSALNARIFARGRVSSIYGMIFMLMSLGAAAGASASGLLHRLTGDYPPGFVVAAVAIVLGGLPFVASRRLVAARELPPPPPR